ncbi:MAG: Na+/H+ antiporter subunit E [Acidimicrobiales bacterium]
MTASRLGDARRRLLLAAWLTAVWLALWGELDPLTALGGAALALGLVALFTPDRSPWLAVRPLAALRFAAHYASALVRASVRLVAVVLRPRPGPVGGVIAVDVATTVPVVVAVIAQTISLTPGTLVLAARPSGKGTRL